jgi:hypothetical protein
MKKLSHAMKITAKLILALILSNATGRAEDPSFRSVSGNERSKPAPLFEDFEGKGLDFNKWLIARGQWGGEDANGGVVPDNIHLNPGRLIIKGNGDKYSGPVRGVRRVLGKIENLSHGRRTGACLVTRDCYASGRFEVSMKVPQNLGVCTALWTFHYLEVGKDHEEYLQNKGKGQIYISNHEIDIELPGRPGSRLEGMGYDWALFNTWVGEREQDMTFGPTKLPFGVNDGKFHTWRFDWHTADPEGRSGTVVEPRVEFYLDGKLLRTITTTVPVDAGHFWIGLWFPKNWAGKADFDVDTLEVDWVRITPFHQAADRYKYSQPGPSHWLLGPEDWPKRLHPNEEEASNKPLE